MDNISTFNFSKSFSSKFVKSWELFILFLSMYVILQLLWEIAIPMNESQEKLLENLDSLICVVFLIDFFTNLYSAEDKKLFFKTRWIDLVSSIPFIELFRVFRITRIMRAIRLFKLFKVIRGIRALSPIIRYITKNKLRSILFSYTAIMILILFYCSVAFYMIEKDGNEMVRSYFDALWWSFITVTSVGYGDVFPRTHEGRIIAMVLTLGGMGMFSLITAELSAKFLKYLNDDKVRE